MNKRGGNFLFFLSLVFVIGIFSFSFISAFSFSEFFDKFTGKATSSFCADSDGGANLTVLGYVSDDNADYADYCVSSTQAYPNHVFEFICNAEKLGVGLLYLCPTGTTCQDGACKSSLPDACPSFPCFFDGKGITNSAGTMDGPPTWLSAKYPYEFTLDKQTKVKMILRYQVWPENPNLPNSNSMSVKVDGASVFSDARYMTSLETKEIDLGTLSPGKHTINISASPNLRHFMFDWFNLTEVDAVSTPTCTSWTYTSYGVCTLVGGSYIQTRTITSSSPADCSGGTPQLTQSCSPTTITCIDTDNGINVYSKGSATRYYGSTASLRLNDTCKDTQVLKEVTCSSGSVPIYTEQTCSSGCLDGACELSAPINTTPVTCADSVLSEGEVKTISVGGENYEVSLNFVSQTQAKFTVNGVLTGLLIKAGTSKLASGAILGLKEIRYSSKDAGVSQVDFAIATGISYLENGACKSAQTTVCTDSDGGLDYSVKGDVSLNGVYLDSDWCIETNDGSLLNEKYCINNSVSGTKYYFCPHICSGGACIEKPICTDSDGGNDYYTKGTVVNFPPENTSSWTDSCITNTTLQEGSCDINFGVHTYSCPYGCSNGTCMEAPKVANKNITSFGTYTLQTGDIIILNNVLAKAVILEYDSCTDNSCYETTKKSEVRFYYLNQGGSSYNGLTEGRSLTFLTSDSSMIYPKYSDVSVKALNFSINRSGYENNEEFNLNKVEIVLSPAGTCQPLIDRISSPVETDKRRLNYNYTSRYSSWINGKEENYTYYYTSWQNYLEPPENGINVYYTSYRVQIYDNKDINLSEMSSWEKENTRCKMMSDYQYDDEKYYFICNWGILDENRNMDNTYQGVSREIFWYNKNVFVTISLDYGRDLTDEEIIRLSQKRLEDLIKDLQSLEYESTSWEDFGNVWSARQEVSNSVNECGSTIDYDWRSGYKTWSCKTEPAICPPHGYQTKTCLNYNYESMEYETSENRIYCNPGICSGCYVPQWFGNKGGDNKCIPYGFRFEQQTEDFVEKWQERIEQENLSEMEEEEASLQVLSDTTATLVLSRWKEGENLTFNLIEGQKVDLPDRETDPFYYYVLLPENIVYYGAGDLKNYVVFKITVRFLGKEYTKVNMYCDIDGEFKIQKTKDYGGEWAKCQNNYECYSNLCSAGECVELHDMMQEVNRLKVLWTRIGCRISAILTSQSYEECLTDSLGPEYMASISE